MIIRNLEEKDAGPVAALILQLTKNIVRPAELTERIQQLVGAQQCQYVVAEDQGQVLGFGGLVWYSIPSKGNIAWLEEIVVDENSRGQGIGKKIMERLLEIASAQNVSVVKLTSNGPTANHLYESFGFAKKDHQYFTKNLLQ